MDDAKQGAATAVDERSGPPTAFRLPTPGNWFDLDLDSRTRNRSIAELVDRRAGTSPETAERRQELVRMLRRVARDAAEHNAVFASMLSDLVEGQPLAAGLNLTIAPVTAGPDSPPLSDPQAVQAALSAASRTGAGEDGRADVQVVELPAGRAVRVSRMRSTDIPGTDGSLLTSEVQYLLPVPASTAMAVLTFSTPTIALADRFAELFDLMAERFEFVWDGGPGG